MLNPRGHPCIRTSHRGRLFGLSLVVLLLLLPTTVQSISPKMILWLIRFKNFRFYNQQQDLFVDSPIPDDMDQTCRQYDAWLDPLIGSSPADDITPPSFDREIIKLLEDETRDDVIRRSNQTISILGRMLDGYQENGLFDDWHNDPPQLTFIPKMFWRRPWNLENKPGDIYQLLTTYSRILHYYVCIMKEEVNAYSRFQRYAPLHRQRNEIRNFQSGGLKKNHIRALGIDDDSGFDSTEVNFFLMMGHVFLKLENTSLAAVSKLTLEHDVNMAINKMRATKSTGMRIFYRANLCLELYHFLRELSNKQNWANNTNRDDVVFALLKKMYGKKTPGPNNVLKDYENDLMDYGNMLRDLR